MGQVLRVPNPLMEDKMAGALLRFNFLNVLKLSGERFVQLHPLLHEYAREKLAQYKDYPKIYEDYLDVIPEWAQEPPKALAVEQPFPIAWHVKDMLATLEEFITRDEWLKAIRLLERVFDVLVDEGYSRRLEQVIHLKGFQHGEDTSESRLLKITFANLKGRMAAVPPKI